MARWFKNVSPIVDRRRRGALAPASKGITERIEGMEPDGRRGLLPNPGARHKLRVRRLWWLVALLLVAACERLGAPPAVRGPQVAAGPGAPPLPGWAEEIASAMHPEVDPCVDFYAYACGGWSDKASLPAGYDRWNRGLSAALEATQQRVRAGLASAEPPDPQLAGARAFFAACERGAAAVDRVALSAVLKRIDEVVDLPSLLSVAGYLHSVGIPVLFATQPWPEQGRLTFALGPGGLSFPPEVYPFRAARPTEAEAAYRGYIARLLRITAPEAGAEETATRVFAFETQLAQAGANPPDQPPRVVARAELQNETPSLPWAKFFDGLGLPPDFPLALAHPAFFTALERILSMKDEHLWRAYLRWQTTYHLSMMLSETSARAAMDLPLRRLLDLSSEPPPRWSLCVAETETVWPEAIDAITQPRDPDVGLSLAFELAGQVSAGLSRSVAASTWMDEPSRSEAERKLASVGWVGPLPPAQRPPAPAAPAVAVGSPDDFIPLLLATRRSRFEWVMRHFDPASAATLRLTRQTSEPLAVYQLNSNALEISQTLMQPPFLDPERPVPINFAVFGTLIGHELSHAIGGAGRLVDADLRPRTWWTAATEESLNGPGTCLAETYGAYVLASDGPDSEPLRLDGMRTWEENYADLGAVVAAYDALARWQSENPLEPPALPGLLDSQLFFLAYAQIWCEKMNSGAIVAAAYFDPHAPGSVRVNGPLSQTPAFARAFSCPLGSPMAPARRCDLFAEPADQAAAPAAPRTAATSD